MQTNFIQAFEWEEVEELSELLFQEDAQEVKTRYTITSVDQLNWAFRKIAAMKRKQQEVEALAANEIHRIEMWKNRELRDVDRTMEFFESLVKEYAIKQRAENATFKKEKTPYGQVSFTAQRPEFQYNDEALVQWLIDNEYYEHVKVTKSVANKSDLKRDFHVYGDHLVDTRNGNVVQGVTVVERPETISVKVEG